MDGWPWHAGEVALQRRVGLADRLAQIGPRAIRDHLTAQHADFYPRLPFIVAGSVDPSGAIWAGLIAGYPGFLSVPDPSRLVVSATRDPEDPVEAGMEDGAAIGLLGIELHSRRRNRLNGTVRREGPGRFTVAVRESFGNCPRYIRLREARFVRDPTERPGPRAEALAALDAPARAQIAVAETLFVASAIEGEDGRRVDVSHRGGRPGFVHVDEAGTLTIPDFAGNAFFNTLGNIRQNPEAGLAFVDFETGGLLQLSGRAELVLDGPEIAAFQGAERLLRVRPRRIVRRREALPLRWRTPEAGVSPDLAAIGRG